MKKILFLLVFCVAALQLSAQNDGISYQAVIIGPDGQELPGMDAEGNILPQATITIRFTILDLNNNVEYQEEQTTNTDQFGRINLVVGEIDPDSFSLVNWDGTLKRLKVEIDFSGEGSDFVDMSISDMFFLPYAYHRDILARGTLTVDDVSDLNGELRVGGPTNLNSSLSVNNDNPTNLSGPLDVDGITTLGDTLNVNSPESNFAGNLNVAPEGTATFNGPTAFNGESRFRNISVNGPANLMGQVSIEASALRDSSDNVFEHYPLMIEGTRQGIAIKVSGSRSGENNFISFWDEDNRMWGRIEGQTVDELESDQDYQIDLATKSMAVATAGTDAIIAGLELVQAGVELAAASSAVTPCVGFGACVTAPPPSMIVSAAANLALRIANVAVVAVNVTSSALDLHNFLDFKSSQIGVTYASGSGDYAEWLPKANPKDDFAPGDIVGVKNGFINKSTSGADRIMVISTKPIVLGNMPPEGRESEYEKTAFMGQVPVKVIGEVHAGDYILPSEYGGGYAKGVRPDEMNIKDYRKIIGIAWSESSDGQTGFVNCAVGLNTNDMNEVIIAQAEKINSLEAEMKSLQDQHNMTNDVLCQLVPGFNDAFKKSLSSPDADAKHEAPESETGKKVIAPSEKSVSVIEEKGISVITPGEDDLIFYDVPRELLVAGLEQARKEYLKEGRSIEDHPFWKRLSEEPEYIEDILDLMDKKFDEAVRKYRIINSENVKNQVSVMK